ncbi:MAG: hypothetical protein ACRD26_09400 [Vicinamibacterales bacterium]
MERHRRRWLLFVIAAIGVGPWAAGGHSQGDLACPPVLVGIWKADSTHETQPIFLGFSADGWVSHLESGGGTRAAEFGVLAQAGYTLDLRRRSPRILFKTRRGSDYFPPGDSSWQIGDYGDELFTAMNVGTGEASRWLRVQTHRYFLTFAAAASEPGGGGPAFAIWTRFDGRRTELDALGLYVARRADGRPAAAFGRLPIALASAFATEADHDGDVMMRVELSEADYHRTHMVFEEWDERLRNRALAPGDPYQRALEFLEQTAARLNQCGVRITLAPAGAPPPAPAVGEEDRRQQPSRFVKRIHQMNRTRHVADGMFPFVWEPPPPL